MKRISHGRGYFRPWGLAHFTRRHGVRPQYLAISSKKSLCALRRGQAARSRHPCAGNAPADIFSPSARVNEILRGGRSGLADVIPAESRDRIPLRNFLRAGDSIVSTNRMEEIRREDELLLRDEFP
ncbi:hypothetical protein [Candidatus Villigracilis saccharophilus]|uniref:hypothetical protein n=1 Tax=Candidatus Villigracilis saccharophilus TaxID=3140684 RepID=UPI0031E58AC8